MGSILEPGKQPKMDKAAILSDAVRMVTQLRMEAQKLKDSNESLQEKIKELKVRLRHLFYIFLCLDLQFFFFFFLSQDNTELVFVVKHACEYL